MPAVRYLNLFNVEVRVQVAASLAKPFFGAMSGLAWRYTAPARSPEVCWDARCDGGLASISVNGITVAEEPCLAEAISMLCDNFPHSVLPFARDFVFVHGSAVVERVAEKESAIVFWGPPGSGKTTAVLSLLADPGSDLIPTRYLSDDVVAIHLPSAQVYPSPFPPRLKRSATADLAKVLDPYGAVRPSLCAKAPVPLGEMIRIRYRPGLNLQIRSEPSVAAALAGRTFLRGALPDDPRQVWRYLLQGIKSEQLRVGSLADLNFWWRHLRGNAEADSMPTLG
jgi:hypothetical protein